MSTNTYIVYWDMTGLEAVVDITEKLARANDFERESLFDRIKEPEKEPYNKNMREINNMIHTMMLRARANPQRHYEIYMLKTNEDITKEDLDRYFDDNAQVIVNLIRERGEKLYSDRIEKRVQVIE